MRKLLLRNWAVKVVSLVLALGLWGMVKGQRIGLHVVDIPLRTPELPDSLMLVSPLPEKVNVTFRASVGELFWLRLQKPTVELAFPLLPTSEGYNVPIKSDLLLLPRQFTAPAMAFDPALINVRLVEVAEKEVQVRPVLGRGPRPPYRLTDGLHCEPQTVLARGPRALIDQIRRVKTIPLILSEETEDGVVSAAISPRDSFTVFEPAKVRVEYWIKADGSDQ